MLRPLYRLLFRLPASLRDKIGLSGRVENRRTGRSSSFTRLREGRPSDQWNTGDFLETGLARASVQVRGATDQTGLGTDIPLGTIKVTDEVKVSGNPWPA